MTPCCGKESGHAPDCKLVAKVCGRDGYRYKTRLGDRRERLVRCRICVTSLTSALSAVCDTCAVKEATYALAHPESVA